MSRPILIADAQPESRERIAARLHDHGFETVSADSGDAALRSIAEDEPQLVILDILLPGTTGAEVLRRLREYDTTAALPVIIVSDRGDEIDRVIGFELGADDYVVKPFSARELVLRVQAVLRRARHAVRVTPGSLSCGPLHVDVGRHEVRVEGKPIPLTALELRLLVRLLRGQGRVLSREHLLAHVWKHPNGVDPRTVDTHIKRLRSKLGPAAAWVETVRGVGYRLRHTTS